MNMIHVNHFKIYSDKVKKSLVLSCDSDWHIGEKSSLKRVDAVQKRVDRVEPDYRFIVGDMIDDTKVLKTAKRKELLQSIAIAGRASVTIPCLGNHDFAHKTGRGELSWEEDVPMDWLEQVELLTAGILTYKNRVYEGIVYLDDQVEVVAMNPPFEYYFKEEESKQYFIDYYQRKKLHFATTDRLHILLLHTPAVAPDCVEELPILQEADLVLCGHMHAGIVPPYARFAFGISKDHLGLRTPNNQLLKNAKYCWGEVEKNGVPFIINPGTTKLGPEKKLLQPLNCPLLLPNEMSEIEVIPTKQKRL